MAHLNIYVPDEVSVALKQQARAAGVSLSRFLLSQVQGDRSGSAWPAGFFSRTCGFLAEDEEMDEPDDALPEAVESLDVP